MMRRFSESAVWRAHQTYYESTGVRAWSRLEVPTHAPNNAYMAAAHVRVIARFLQEGGSLPVGHPLRIDPHHPVYLIELGGGSGQFAHLMLSMLRRWHERTRQPIPIRYVLTDIAEERIEYWRRHRLLAPLFASGVLLAGKFDVLADEAIDLGGGERIAVDTLANPAIVVANYVLDSLPADFFRVRDGRVEEALVDETKLPPAEPSPDWAVPLEYVPARLAPYGDPDVDAIVARYRSTLGNTCVTIPTGAIASLRALDRLSGGRMLVFACDKGYIDETDLRGITTPSVVRHADAISLTVNFDALGRFQAGRGGFMLATTERDPTLHVALLVSGASDLPDTRRAFHEVYEDGGPIDVLRAVTTAMTAEKTIAQCIAFLRLACHDPWVFHALEPQLRDKVLAANEQEKAELRRALPRVAALHFPLTASIDVYFEIGVLMASINRFNQARTFFRSSLEHHGDNHLTYFNLSLCTFELGETDEAVRLVERALELEPDDGLAREWRLRYLREREKAQSSSSGS